MVIGLSVDLAAQQTRSSYTRAHAHRHTLSVATTHGTFCHHVGRAASVSLVRLAGRLSLTLSFSHRHTQTQVNTDRLCP